MPDQPPHYCYDCSSEDHPRCRCDREGHGHDDGTLTCATCGKRGYLKCTSPKSNTTK